MESRSLKTVVVGAMLLGVTFLVGHRVGRGEVTRPGSPAKLTHGVAMESTPATLAPAPASAQRDLAELRAIIREELAQSKAAEPLTAGAPKADPDHESAAPPPVGNLPNLDAAHRMVASASASHAWTPKDARAFDELLPTMSPDERREAMSALFSAINRQEIKPEGRIL